ncbi:MAG: uroporphyrinogen-III synthase [Anaerolineae bacterium]
MPELHPLAGKRVLVTRGESQAAELIAALTARGAHPIHVPTIELVPPISWDRVAQALAQRETYDWVVFTSANGIRFFDQYVRSTGQSATMLANRRIAAIGPATARAIERVGLRVTVVPDEFIAEAVADALGNVRGQRILLLRAAQAREALAVILRERGAAVDEVAVYDTAVGRPSPDALAEARRGIDIATFTSSSTVRNFFILLAEDARPLLEGALIVCIGPITTQTAREYGLTPALVAERYTIDGLVETLSRAYDASAPSAAS